MDELKLKVGRLCAAGVEKSWQWAVAVGVEKSWQWAVAVGVEKSWQWAVAVGRTTFKKAASA